MFEEFFVQGQIAKYHITRQAAENEDISFEVTPLCGSIFTVTVELNHTSYIIYPLTNGAMLFIYETMNNNIRQVGN
jgi:hypothetical protein